LKIASASSRLKVPHERLWLQREEMEHLLPLQNISCNFFTKKKNVDVFCGNISLLFDYLMSFNGI
jgi:hypothetical protein